MRFLVLILLLFYNYSFNAQHKRTNKNFLIVAESGLIQNSEKFLGSFFDQSGYNFGIGFGKYISTKKTGVLPVSVRIQYNYHNISLPLDPTHILPVNLGGNNVDIKEHWITFPVQFDAYLFSVLLNKSSHHECRSLNSGLSLAIYPGFGFVDGYEKINKKWPLPLEVGYSINISKSGGHKSVASKDIHIYIFARLDLNSRFKPLDLSVNKVHEHSFGVRLQFTHYKTYNFLNVN